MCISKRSKTKQRSSLILFIVQLRIYPYISVRRSTVQWMPLIIGCIVWSRRSVWDTIPFPIICISFDSHFTVKPIDTIFCNIFSHVCRKERWKRNRLIQTIGVFLKRNLLSSYFHFGGIFMIIHRKTKHILFRHFSFLVVSRDMYVRDLGWWHCYYLQ